MENMRTLGLVSLDNPYRVMSARILYCRLHFCMASDILCVLSWACDIFFVYLSQILRRYSNENVA